MIASLDGTANESVCPEIRWDGFPTILLIKAGTRTPIPYQSGNRAAPEVYKWLVEHASSTEGLEKELGEVKMDL